MNTNGLSPLMQAAVGGEVKTIAGQDIIKGEGEDEGNFYYETIDGEQIFIEDPDGVVAKNVTDGMVSDLDFSFEETEDGYYKVTGVAGEGGEQPVRPEDVVPSMMPGGVGETPMEMHSAFQKHTQEHEGNETMGSERLKNEFGIEGLESSTDYYIKRGEQGEPMILGEVDLEDGNVTGVPGSNKGKLTRKND